MIKLGASAATATLAKSFYPRESIESGAVSVGERAKVFLETAGSSWKITIKPVRKTTKKELTRLVGAFLNESISHALRQKSVALNRALTAPVLARTLDSGFPNIPHDPLEQLEPQVRADREQDVAQLFEAAQKWL